MHEIRALGGCGTARKAIDMAVHEFNAATSGECDTHEWWEGLYRECFPGFRRWEIETDVARQKRGIDHNVILRSNRQVYVDVKCRHRQPQYTDVLLESHHEFPDGRMTQGWALDPMKVNDFVAYGHEGSALLIPTYQLALAIDTLWDDWTEFATHEADGFRWVEAKNRAYTSVNLAVPRKVFLRSVPGTIEVEDLGRKRMAA